MTVTAASEGFIYDGSAHSNNGYKVDGLVGTDAISAVVTGSITFPSESPVTNTLTSYKFTAGTPGNYSVTTVNGELRMMNADAAITITAASDSWTYDGAAHSNSAVTVTKGKLHEGDELVATATGSVTNVADTAAGNNPIAEGYRIMHGEEDVTKNYVITAEAGTLTVSKAAVTVRITGHTGSPNFSGEEQRVEGYEVVSISNPLYTADDFTLSGEAVAKGTHAGTYQMGLEGRFTNTNGNFDVSFDVTDGWLKIERLKIDVRITGHEQTNVYDGAEHSVSGYDVEISNPLFRKGYITFSGVAGIGEESIPGVRTLQGNPDGAVPTEPADEVNGPEVTAKRTDVGKTNMGLAESQFTNTSAYDDYDVTFMLVKDGSQEITKRPLELTANNADNLFVAEEITFATAEDAEAPYYGITGGTSLAEGQNITRITLHGAGTHAGTYPITIDRDSIEIGAYTDNYDITVLPGTLTIGRSANITVTKMWEDKAWTRNTGSPEDDFYGLRPDSVEYTLRRAVAGGTAEVVDTVTATADDGYAYAWAYLPAADDSGNAYVYTVAETRVNGYRQAFVEPGRTVGDDTDDYFIAVTNMLDIANVTVQKIWNDESDRYGLRPNELSLTLEQNAETMAKAPAAAVTKNGNIWTYVWSQVPVSDSNGEPYDYSVTESAVPNGYVKDGENTTDISGAYSGEIVNELETLEVTAYKFWDDDGDAYNTRPADLTLTLYRNGEAMANAPAPEVVKEEDTWTYVWSRLPVRDNAGTAYQYDVREEAANIPDSYIPSAPSVTYRAEDGVIVEITNRLSVTELTVVKEWVDEAADVAGRPNVEVTLMNRTENTPAMAPITLTRANNWTATVLVPYQTADGRPIVYEWIEAAVPGYRLSDTLVDGVVTTLVNERLAPVPEGTFTLTVHYRYLDGTEAAATVTEEYTAGEAYSIGSPVIEGYFANRLVVSGVMPNRDVTVTVLYFKPGEVIEDYQTALGLGNVYSNLGECLE